VVAAIVGAAGLASTLAAARAGKRLLLANKESLVIAGHLVMAAAQQAGCEIIPIDSEHNAIFQCLRSRDASPEAGVRKIILTASGGPFRGWSAAQLADVTPAQAVAHPKWRMGPKISVDSASLMNKGLEVIEAHHLFNIPSSRIEVVVHRQSLVHSLVEFIDGSLLAQLGLPDMRTSLAVGLGWPQRIDSGVSGLDLLTQGQLDFEAPTARPSRAWTWPGRRWRTEASPRPCSTPPMRSRCRPSSAATLALPASRWWWNRPWPR
jgi:1-deoxy-D-xylulose 5-phosphate reductoisomerase